MAPQPPPGPPEMDAALVAVLDVVPVPAAVLDAAGVIAAVNTGWESATGWPPEATVGRRLGDLIDPDDAAVLAIPAAGEAVRVRVRVRPAPGTRLTPASCATPVILPANYAAADLPSAVLGRRWVELAIGERVVTADDVTLDVANEEAAARLAFIVEHTNDMVGISDANFGIAYMNQAAKEAFGLDDTALRNTHTFDLYQPEAFDKYYAQVRPALLRDGTWSGEIPMRDAFGDPIAVWQTVVAKVSDTEAIEWLATVGRDITERKAIESRLAHDATHDPLTGIPNRSLVYDRLEQALARMARSGPPPALLFLDLDGFKDVNDTYGHEAGDELLRRVARRLAVWCRPSDTVARFGGDEFVVLCDGVGSDGAAPGASADEEAMAIGRRLLRALLDEPFSMGEGDARVGASIGVAVAPSPEVAPESLIRRADQAMYQAKNSGRGNVRLAP